MSFLNDKIDIAMDFCKKNHRYFAAGLVGLGMVFMLYTGNAALAEDADPTAGVYQQFSDEGENEQLVKLLQTYYDAYDSNNALTYTATPISDSEKSYIKMLSQYVDRHEIVKVYSKKGASDGSLLVSVYVNIYFKGLKNPAPGLDFFYVETNSEGYMYINNLYSAYNLNNAEQAVNPTIATMIAEFEQQEDVLALQAEVQKNYNEITIEDSNLKTFVESTLQDAINKWASDYKKQIEEQKQKAKEEEEAKKKAAEDAKKAAEDAKKAEEAAAAAAAANAAEEASKIAVVTTEKVNVRAAAADDAQSLGKVDGGTQLYKYAEEGEWSKIDYNGTKAYIKTQFLTPVDTTATTNAAVTTPAATTTPSARNITLTNTINIRSSQDENASKVAVAYTGNQVAVVEDYANGWSKVSFGGQEGYAKTEYLK